MPSQSHRDNLFGFQEFLVPYSVRYIPIQFLVSPPPHPPFPNPQTKTAPYFTHSKNPPPPPHLHFSPRFTSRHIFHLFPPPKKKTSNPSFQSSHLRPPPQHPRFTHTTARPPPSPARGFERSPCGNVRRDIACRPGWDVLDGLDTVCVCWVRGRERSDGMAGL